MSEVNAAAIHGPYRRKVTLACDSCRKRRVKCSGSQPCALCSEHGRHCEFDSKNRPRRGPRPRQPVPQGQRVIRPLAPRIPATVGNVDRTWHTEEQGTPAVEGNEGNASDYDVDDGGGVTHGNNGDDAEDDDDADSADDDDEMPDPSVWRPGLEDLISRNKSISQSLPALGVDLMCHLIHMFCTRASSQLRLLLPPNQIQHQLSQGIMSLTLVLAICASGMRFSVHKTAKAPQTRALIEAAEREVRQRLCASNLTWEQIDNVKTVCVLVDYEASKSRGRRAWVSIAMGRSLVQLARSASDLDAEQLHVLDIAERYLTITQVSHSLGHLHLQATTSSMSKRQRLECAPCPEDCPHLIDLLGILASVHQLCRTPFRLHQPPPWTTGSKFRALQDELEEYLLRHPVTFRFGSNSPPGANCDTKRRLQGDLDASISSLVWHCCVIALNRTFLPIPERRPLAGETAGDRHQTTTLHSVVEFPHAPPLFLRERVHRCESSADAICSISKDVIKTGGFYSHAVLVGFACAQSALVSINSLHRSSKPYDDRVVENLKSALIVLGAVQTFYAPAKDWMNVVLRVHDTNTTRLSHLDGSGASESSFNSYFDRFLDLEEPAFMPFDPVDSESTEKNDDVGGDEASGYPLEPKSKSGTGAHGTNGAADDSPVWLQAYTDHLCGDIEVDDADEAEPSMEHRPQGSTNHMHVTEQPLQSAEQPGMATISQPIPVPAPVPLAVPVVAEEVVSVQHQHLFNEPPPPFSEHSVQMASAILASMSTGTSPNFALQAQDSTDTHMHDGFSDLFGQMASFDMPTPSSMFMGLGVTGDQNMWLDMLNQQMLK